MLACLLACLPAFSRMQLLLLAMLANKEVLA